MADELENHVVTVEKPRRGGGGKPRERCLKKSDYRFDSVSPAPSLPLLLDPTGPVLSRRSAAFRRFVSCHRWWRDHFLTDVSDVSGAQV